MLLFILALISVISILVVILVIACKRYNNRVKDVIETIKNKLFFSIFIRYSLQSYLDLNISAMLVLAENNFESDRKLVIYSFLTALLILLPAAYLKLLRRMFKRLENPDV